MTDKYLLNENDEPVPVEDLMTWALAFEDDKKRRVALDQIGDSRVSTVFLALDHNYSGKGEPILWETMVFGGEHDGDMDRCSGKRVDALEMHKRMVEHVKGKEENI